MKSFLTECTKHLRSSLTRHGCTIGRYKSTAFADRERGYFKGGCEGESIAIIASFFLSRNRFSTPGASSTAFGKWRRRDRPDRSYLGYARQDRSDGKGTAGIGVMVTELLRQTKASRLLVCDIHSERIRKASVHPSLNCPPCRSLPRPSQNGLPR